MTPASSSRRADSAGRYPMNRSEHGYLALHGMMGSFNQPYMFRLNQPVDEARVRAGFRRLLSAHPRLRMVVEPGLHIHHFCVLPDDEVLDQLFDQAFRVVTHVDLDDPARFEAYHQQQLNEPLSVERGLAVRFVFHPHEQRPLLVLNVHHMMLDGRSLLRLIGDMVGWLNGHDIEPTPMECRSLWPTTAPRRWRDWPAKLRAAWAYARGESTLNRTVKAVQVPTRLTTHFSNHAVLHHTLAVGTERLRPRARQLGVSLNTVIVALLAEAFLRLEDQDPRSAAVIRLSVDLRRFYAPDPEPAIGNYVAAFLVRDARRGIPFAERVQAVQQQVATGMKRFEDRQAFWNYISEEALALLGRTLVTHLAWKMKRGDKFPRISVHATSLGDAGRTVNRPGAAVRMTGLWGVAPSVSLLMVLTEVDGRLHIPTSFQRCETDPQAVRAFMHLFDEVAREVADEAERLAAATPSAAEGSAKAGLARAA